MAPYRDNFVRLAMQIEPDFKIYAGNEYFDPSIRLSSFIQAHLARELRNRFFARRKLLWQSGAVGAAVRVECAVLEFNPRIVSNWVALLARRALGRRTLLWGHALPRAGEAARTKRIRFIMLRLADAAIVYTPADRVRLQSSVSCKVHVAANAVSGRDDTLLVSGSRMNAVQLGRLVPAKKPDLALRAWTHALPDLPREAKLLFIGDGPMKRTLRQQAKASGVDDRVLFLGEVFGPKNLDVIFADALLTIVAGYAGLSVTQSLAYGIPIVVASDEPHAPEISLCDESNSTKFISDDEVDLARKLIVLYANRRQWIGDRVAISDATLAIFSTEAMVAGFLQAARDR